MSQYNTYILPNGPMQFATPAQGYSSMYQMPQAAFPAHLPQFVASPTSIPISAENAYSPVVHNATPTNYQQTINTTLQWQTPGMAYQAVNPQQMMYAPQNVAAKFPSYAPPSFAPSNQIFSISQPQNVTRNPSSHFSPTAPHSNQYFNPSHLQTFANPPSNAPPSVFTNQNLDGTQSQNFSANAPSHVSPSVSPTNSSSNAMEPQAASVAMPYIPLAVLAHLQRANAPLKFKLVSATEKNGSDGSDSSKKSHSVSPPPPYDTNPPFPSENLVPEMFQAMGPATVNRGRGRPSKNSGVAEGGIKKSEAAGGRKYCRVCWQFFKGNISRHEATHYKEKIKCKFCDKGCARVDSLNRHLKTCEAYQAYLEEERNRELGLPPFSVGKVDWVVEDGVVRRPTSRRKRTPPARSTSGQPGSRSALESSQAINRLPCQEQLNAVAGDANHTHYPPAPQEFAATAEPVSSPSLTHQRTVSADSTRTSEDHSSSADDVPSTFPDGPMTDQQAAIWLFKNLVKNRPDFGSLNNASSSL
ncbi:hypothetical protein BJ138DRAFT_1104442 [Hygrophoropsis aurantiaca]|uniref:Uncharacterized protein n=1 Tax=Hygrophoropsis aurantiaca TaxID=72124 RepID=A0ACB8A2W4_9AGAM|nr:hypothetical protein BJ138DRAFT_1104442 [Hygrophoropsis aurantiaca]